MYHDSPYKKENWYGFRQPVYVPLEGEIIEVQNNIPDNDYEGKTLKPLILPTEADSEGMGNYVIIQHANGEYSMLMHLEKGSINVKEGDVVKVGDQIGA